MNGNRGKWDVVSIPEGRSGAWEIRHRRFPAGTEFKTANERCVLFGGQQCVRVIFEGETLWHFLTEDGGVWMRDFPDEVAQHVMALAPMRGRVLVGGLGLGVAVTLLGKTDGVESVVVVEREPAVIDLVWPHLEQSVRDKTELVPSCLFEYLVNAPHDFDWAFFDIWTGDGTTTFHDVVVPLRLVAGDVVPEQSRIVCWNEEVMRGQLYMELLNRLEFPGMFGRPDVAYPRQSTGDKWSDWMVPFFGQFDASDLPPNRRKLPALRQLARVFAYEVVGK